MNGYTDDQVEMNKWVYVADNGYNNQPINRGWCEAAGGEWYVPGANPYCINLPGGVPGVIGGGGRITNDEDLSLSIASGFVAEYLQPCGAQLVSDSGWTPTADRSFGVPITMNRERAYMAVGQNCSSGVTIYFSKIRAARCPPGYRSRTAVTGPECFIPAKCIPCAGKSVSVTTGAKYQREDDYVDAGQTGLHFTRYYNSTGYYWPEYLSSTYYSSSGDLHLTDSWRHTYGDRFMLIPDNTEVMAVIQRPDGTLQVFDTSGDEKTNGAGGGGAHVTLVPGIGWDVTRADATVERYDGFGNLVSITTSSGQVTTITEGDHTRTVTGPFGHTLTLTYNDDNQPISLTLPDGNVITYQYEQTADKRFTGVIYPDGTSRQYQYGNVKNRYLLTGIVDESGQTFGSYSYDDNGRVIAESHAGGVDSYVFSYGAAFGDPTTVTDPLGTSTDYGLVAAGGMYRSASYSQQCMACGSAASTTYDANGNPATRTDFNGDQTVYSYNTRNLEASRTEAAGTPRARTITTQWHPTFRLPTEIDEPGRETTFTYDGSGNLLTKTVTDTAASQSRTWTMTYNGLGQLSTVDGPRTDVSDVTTYTYYSCSGGGACGQIHTITDGAGNLTTYLTYNADGQPLTISDPNGTITTLTYDERQRLTSRTVAAETTTIEYWPTGLLKKVTQPDGSFVQYAYDAAHRLTGVTDTDGNSITYTLDGAGNRVAEAVHDPSSTLTQSLTRTFDSLGRLEQQVGSAGQTTSYTYDGDGNVRTETDPYGRVTSYGYDELDRLSLVTDPMLGLTDLSYDGTDNLLTVTDPRSLTTAYTYDGFGDQTALTSPDTGTSMFTFDPSGAIATGTDARNATGT